MKINILFLIESLQKGGAERVASLIMNNLAANKLYQIHLMSFYHKDEKYKYFLDKNIYIIKSDHENAKQDILNFLDKTQINLIINFICINDYIELIAAKYPHIKYIYTIHSTPFYLVRYLNKILKIARKSHATTVLNSYSYKAFSLAGATNLTIMPNVNTFDTKDITPKLVNNNNILSIGDFTRDNGENKRLDRAIRVLAEVKKTHPNAVLFIAGLYDLELKIAGAKETLQEIIDHYNLKIGEDIIFTGLVNNISTLYKQCAVYILTSTFEGMPMVVLEAGVHGLPVVANKINGLEDVIINGKNGFIVEQDDIISMAEKVAILLQNTKLKHEMSVQAIELAKRYNNGNIIPRWEKLINIVLNNERLEIDNILKKENQAANIYTAEDYKNLAEESMISWAVLPVDDSFVNHGLSEYDILHLRVANRYTKRILLGIKYLANKLGLLWLLKKILY